MRKEGRDEEANKKDWDERTRKHGHDERKNKNDRAEFKRKADRAGDRRQHYSDKAYDKGAKLTEAEKELARKKEGKPDSRHALQDQSVRFRQASELEQNPRLD